MFILCLLSQIYFIFAGSELHENLRLLASNIDELLNNQTIMKYIEDENTTIIGHLEHLEEFKAVYEMGVEPQPSLYATVDESLIGIRTYISDHDSTILEKDMVLLNVLQGSINLVKVIGKG